MKVISILGILLCLAGMATPQIPGVVGALEIKEFRADLTTATVIWHLPEPVNESIALGNPILRVQGKLDVFFAPFKNPQANIIKPYGRAPKAADLQKHFMRHALRGKTETWSNPTTPEVSTNERKVSIVRFDFKITGKSGLITYSYPAKAIIASGFGEFAYFVLYPSSQKLTAKEFAAGANSLASDIRLIERP
ncbi:hypothetical protein JNK13_01565 [bacterium]|nr:hypothetical protein [bacterium]